MPSGTLKATAVTSEGAIEIEASFLVILTIFGLLFGSFANVVIWRFPRGESVSYPASHCPACDTPILPRDNIPVLSWLLLKGRCRACGVPISPRYPVVELMSGLLWLSAGLRFGMTVQTGFAVFFFFLLLILTWIDIDTMRLPNPLVGLLAVVGLVGAVLSQLTLIPAVPLLAESVPVVSSPLLTSLVGAVVCAGPALLLSLVMGALLKRPALGMGDVKLLGVMGVYLGLYGLLGFFVGSLIGAIYGISTARGRETNEEAGRESEPPTEEPEAPHDEQIEPAGRRPGQPFPFGPSLAAGAVIATLVGPQLWGWYQSLFGL